MGWIARLSAGSLCAAALAGTAVAQPVPADAPAPLDLRMPLAGGVTLHGDVTYSVLRGYRPLTMDIYRPAAADPRPVVIHLHGGGWESGSRRDSLLAGGGGPTPDRAPAALARLAAQGYVVASISYRLSGEARYPAPVEDLYAAIRFLRAHAQDYGIDPRRVVTWGASAGAPIVLNQAFDCRRRDLDPDRQAPEACPIAVVDWYGPADFAPPYGGRQLDAFLGCARTQCPETFRTASSIHSIGDRPPPVFILHGTADKPVPIAQSRRLEAGLRAAGGTVILRPVEGPSMGCGAPRRKRSKPPWRTCSRSWPPTRVGPREIRVRASASAAEVARAGEGAPPRD